MMKTEGVNRIASAYGGAMYFETLLASMRGEAPKEWWQKTFASKKEIDRAMKDIWKLSDEEISFLKQKKIDNSQEAQDLRDWIQTKVYHFSHASSQGSTSTAMLPLWMSGRVAKPLTLFQRMAFSTTNDIVKNYVKPFVKFQNPAPLLRALVGHGISGALLYELYGVLFDTDVPFAESESWLNKLLPYLFRSEFAGLF